MTTTVVVDTEDKAAVDTGRRLMVGKKTLMIGGGTLLSMLIAGGLAAFVLLEPGEAKRAHEVPADVFVDVPPITVNLRSAGGAVHLIKLHVLLVPSSAASGKDVAARLPLVIDAFQPFLRELRPEDLAGSAATFRIKEELLVRANGVTGGNTVTDVLIQDLVEQ